MPTYEYRCPLGHDFEKFYRSIGTAEVEVACPECGQIAERRMSAGAGLVFKGSGFYLTDYGKNAHQNRGPGDGKPVPTQGSGSAAEGGKTGDGGASGGSESAGGGSSESKAAEAPKTEKAQKKAEPKPAESKPAPAPPKSSSGE
jgi:putative FmdB family regulatory protein